MDLPFLVKITRNKLTYKYNNKNTSWRFGKHFNTVKFELNNGMINILSPPKTLTQRASKAFPPVCVKFLLPWASFFLTADCMSCHFFFKFPPLLLWTVDCRLTVSTLHMCTSAYYEKSITIVLHLEA